jgi:cytochrome c553
MNALYALFLPLTLCGTVNADDRAAKNNYMLHCQGCHTPDGAGAEGKVPSLKDFMGKFLHVEGGREFLIQVPGASQSALTDTQLAALTNWMLSSFSAAQVPGDFKPYSGAEVGDLRKNTLVHVGDIRAELLQKMAVNATLFEKPVE